MFADVEPFAKVISRSPRPGFIDSHEPTVAAFAEFGEGLLAAFTQEVQIIIEVMTLKCLPGGFPEIHWDNPVLKLGALVEFVWAQVVKRV